MEIPKLPSFHSVSIFRRIGARIGIHGGITVDSNNVDFNQWKETHVVKIDGKEAQGDQYLLVWYAITHGGNAHTQNDSEGYLWKAMVDIHRSIYKGSGNKNKSITIVKRDPKAEFTFSTQNCLYGNVDANQPNDLTVFEREMIPKTQDYTPHDVKVDNLYWSRRALRIVANVRIDHQNPDILLLQETSPKMYASLYQLLGGPYRHVLSKVGDMGGGLTTEGHCIVAWNPEKFNFVDILNNVSYSRIVAVELQHRASKRPVVVASVHLPASGNHNASPIATAFLKKWPSVPMIIGGDFNVAFNPFDGFANISGNNPTFFNDMKAKLDWVVANHNVTSSHVEVNSNFSSRWPNKKEGSDHTSIRMNFLRLLLIVNIKDFKRQE